MNKAIHTPNAPAAIGPYSQGVAAGNTAYISGQLPIDPATGEFAGADIASQTRQSLLNMQAILAANGMTMADVDVANKKITMDDLQSQKAVDLATRMGSWWNTSGVAWNQDGNANGGGDNRHLTFSNEDTFMFVAEGNSINFYRERADFNWGAVVLPKYDNAQKEYYSQVYESCAMWLIPVDARDTTMSGALLTALDYYGWTMCVDAYIEDVLYSKAATSAQAAYMYDIMIDSMIFDFGTYYQCSMYNDGSTQSPFFRYRSAVNRNVNWATEWLIYKDGFMEGIKNLYTTLANLPN